jgi:hypothetical protein
MQFNRPLFPGLAVVALFPLCLSSAQGLGFAAVGPTSPAHGYPEWYEDTRGVRLDFCLETTGFCLLEGPSQVVNPGAPFPANFGGDFTPEAFYNLAEASMTSNGGGLAILIMALEASFDPEVIADGNQVVFSRFRVRVDNLIEGETYVVTTPLGVHSFVAQNSGIRGIDFTDDAGRLAGVFDGALGSEFVGPFLMWDSDLPITDANGREYVGNPLISHTVTGSPYGTNIFRIRGPSVGGPGINMIETSLFTVSGLLSGDPTEPPPPPPPPPPAAGINLGISPGAAGQTNTLTSAGGTDGSLTAFLFGFRDGTRTIASNLCPTGITIGMQDPRLLGLATTSGGSASASFFVPGGLMGANVNIQSIDIGSCESSNLLNHTF